MGSKTQITNLIVGCGISGATLAHRIATELGEDVLIIDSRDHLAGSCYDEWNEQQICIHRYGAHIFHTQNAEVWRYLSQFTKWVPYRHEVKALIDGQEVPIPFNLNSIRQCFPADLAARLEARLVDTYGFNAKVPILQLRETGDADLTFLADYVYEKVFLHYTLKQWGMKPEELDASVMARVPVFVSFDNRYFQDKYQGIPLRGYTEMVRNMLNHPRIRVRLNTDFERIREEVEYKRLFYTGQIDEFFGFCHGALPYRSLRFEFQEYEQRWFQSRAVINYPCNYDYTRICEPKHFLDKNAPNTVIALEYPQAHEPGRTTPYYPIASDASSALYARYRQMADALGETYFLGRLGDYRYYNMDEAVARALKLADSLPRPENPSQKQPLVSILVPIFRVEKYLRQCVDSILAQTLRDLEVILIDDGSDDACPQICDEYAARDPRVRVIHKPNSGYGASMNRGLSEARGHYIGIVESDDWVEPDMFEKLCALANRHKVQVVRSNFIKYTDKKGNQLRRILPEPDYEQVICPRQRTGVFFCQPAIWTALYERAFLDEAQIRFLESPGASYQDVGFNFKVWAMAKRVWLTPEAWYHYRCDHMGSSINSQGKAFCVVDEWKEVERYLDQYPAEKRASFVLRNYIKLGNYKWNLKRLKGESREAFRKVFSQEYREALIQGGLIREAFSGKEWNELMKVIYANPWSYALHHLKLKLKRLFIKCKIRNGKRQYSVLCGLVRYEKDIPQLGWTEETEK